MDVRARRQRAKTGTYWTVNGKPFDPHRVDVEVPLGSTQTWLLKNVSPITHYIHLHEEQWHTISRDGKRPPPWERGLEDTWRLDPGETVKVAAQFTDYTGVFMLHCHMLDHEDDGMMAQFAVVEPTSSQAAEGLLPGIRQATDIRIGEQYVDARHGHVRHDDVGHGLDAEVGVGGT